MPLKNGRLTNMERRFADAMARTNDAAYAAAKAGYGSPTIKGYQLAAKPAIKAETLRIAEETLRNELLPLALETHKRLLTDKAVPAGAQLGATKLAYDRTLGVDEGKAEKEPAEMSYAELQDSIERLRRQQDLIADQAQDVTPLPPASTSVFD